MSRSTPKSIIQLVSEHGLPLMIRKVKKTNDPDSINFPIGYITILVRAEDRWYRDSRNFRFCYNDGALNKVWITFEDYLQDSEAVNQETFHETSNRH